MFNLFKMDMYRLLHSASTWIILFFVVVLSVFCVVMTNTDIELMEKNPETVMTEQTEERMVGIMVEPDSEWITGYIEAGSVISAEVRSEILALLCVIFAAVFTNAEYKNGFIKNIVGQFPKRWKLILSKWLVIAIQVFVMLLVFVVVNGITGLILWKNHFYMGSVLTLLQFLGTQYLLHLGVASVIMFLSILTYSTAFGMTTGILVCSGLLVPIYSMINKFVYDIRPGWDFDLNNYLLDGNITMLQLSSETDILLRAVFVGIAFIMFSAIFAMIIIKKRDIR